MLLQALVEYADRYLAGQLNDAAWEEKPVPWVIDLSTQGTFLGAVPRMQMVARGKKQVSVPLPLAVPRSPVNRNSGEHPLLTADDIAYVLGVGAWTSEKESDRRKAESHHEAFRALVERAAEKTGDERLRACRRFYERPEQVELAREALREAKPGMIVALSVGEPLVHCEAVRAYWRSHYEAAFAARMAGASGECLISGEFGPVAPTHEKIKGVSNLGGQPAGVALMSFDKEAFRSYGWEQNQNSPVSPGRALAYVLALNDLLRQGNVANRGRGRRIDVAGVGFLTWLREPEDFEVFDLLEQADPETVAALLALDPGVDPHPNRFYLVGVSGNGGRLRVNYWLTEDLTQVKANLRNWHEQLRVFYPWEGQAPVRMWQLRQVLHREAEPPKALLLALYRRALEGPAQPLGYAVLSTVLGRLRHPGGLSQKNEARGDHLSPGRLRVPMGLVRLCVNDILRTKGESEMGEGLDRTCEIPAYVCGRLLAEYENLQRTASESEVNSTVIDRYFALASTYPGAAFPKIENLGQKHLSKLRRAKETKKVAAYRAISQTIGELHELLKPEPEGAFPAKLSLADQGLFALGYYHQKTAAIAQAMERKATDTTAKAE